MSRLDMGNWTDEQLRQRRIGLESEVRDTEEELRYMKADLGAMDDETGRRNLAHNNKALGLT